MQIKDPYGFIYITTNKINGKRYIGRKVFDSSSRWKSYLGSGDYLRASIKKYGKENFSRNIVDIAYSNEELNEKEREWISVYNAVESENFYNLIEGGDIVDVLNRKNSIIVICIDTGEIFKSLKEVYDRYGFTPGYIKSTFNKSHSIKNYYEENLIFRRLEHFDEAINVCHICGEIINSETIQKNLCYKHNVNKNKIKRKIMTRCVVCNKLIHKNSNRQKYCKKHTPYKVKTKTKAKYRKRK